MSNTNSVGSKINEYNTVNYQPSDTSLWLTNKLGLSNDFWTDMSIYRHFNQGVLARIKHCFPELQTEVKMKLLLSFLQIPVRYRKKWHTDLEGILEVAQTDTENWVSMLGEVLSTLPATGSLNTDIVQVDANRLIFSELVNDLRNTDRKWNDLETLPLESCYLSESALNSFIGGRPNPVAHFTLKRKPKSVLLREHLLRKSLCMMNISKHYKNCRTPAKVPVKNIPDHDLASQLLDSLVRPRASTSHKGGIKLLDIDEQPLGYAARKKLQRSEEGKRASNAAGSSQFLTDYSSDLDLSVNQ